MGGVYPRGNYWHIWFKDQFGQRQFEGAYKKWNHKEAKTELSKREALVANHEYKGKHIERVTYDDLMALVIEDYRINGRKSGSHTEKRIKRMDTFFKGLPAMYIPTKIKPFVIYCQGKGWSNAYINRFLSIIMRGFTLGYQHVPRMVAEIPSIPKLQENNVRSGFFEHKEYLTLHAALPHYLRMALTIGYLSGVRKGEAFGIQLSDVNFVTGAIRFPDTKNGDPRVIYLTGKYYEELLVQKDELDAKYPSCTYLIHHDGQPIRDFRGAWGTACKTAGISGKLFHDLRRTAARNMLAAGRPEKEIMQIGGWKTRSILDRYNIVNEENLKATSYATAEYLARVETEIRKSQERKS